MPSTPVSLSRRTVALLLAGIVLVSGLASAWAAWAEPNSRREWDERHAMDNVKSILTTGKLRPTFALYPSLAYLPHTAVLGAVRGVQRLAGVEPLAVVDSQGFATPAVYRICRLIGVLFALGAVLLTYVAGRRIFGQGVGLLAALLMAVSPWFVRGATVFKPDPLLVLLTMATLLWSLDAAERGALKSYLLAGLGVGLTAAAKQNGALAAIAVIAATLYAPLERRRWVGLALAGVASALVFVVVNPFPDLVVHYTQIGGKYAAWVEGQQEAAPMPHVLVYLPRLFVSAAWHGPIVGIAALVGMALLPVELVRRKRAGRSGAGVFLVLAFVVGFPLACAAISSYPKANIFLPLLPFTSLTSAWVLATAWSLATRRLAARHRRWALAAGVLAVLAALVPEAAAYVHYRAVPRTTVDTAALWIETTAPNLAHRFVVHEQADGAVEVEHRWTGTSGQRMWTVAEEGLDVLPPAALDLADYEVFPEARLAGSTSAFYMDRLLELTPADAIWIARPSFGAVRGRPQMVLAHPWRAVEPGLPVRWRRAGKGDGSLRGRLPEGLVAGQTVSFDLTLTGPQGRECGLTLGGRDLELRLYSWQDESLRWMTRRLRLSAPKAPLRLECPEGVGFEGLPATELWRWIRD